MTEFALTIPVANDTRRYQSVPNEQHHYRTDDGGNETSPLIRPVPADGLTDPGGNKAPYDAEQRRKDETLRVVRTRHEPARNQSCNKTHDYGPDEPQHRYLLGTFLAAKLGATRPPPRGRLYYTIFTAAQLVFIILKIGSIVTRYILCQQQTLRREHVYREPYEFAKAKGAESECLAQALPWLARHAHMLD
jgi:hypothetical protein